MTLKELRWASVYGSYYALLVHQRMRDGRGPPDFKEAQDFAEESSAVADVSQIAFAQAQQDGTVAP